MRPGLAALLSPDRRRRRERVWLLGRPGRERRREVWLRRQPIHAGPVLDPILTHIASIASVRSACSLPGKRKPMSDANAAGTSVASRPERRTVLNPPGAQARQVFHNLRVILQSVGVDLDAITKLTVYVTSFDWFVELAAIRGELFPEGPPASSLIQVAGLVLAEFLIEVDAVAAI